MSEFGNQNNYEQQLRSISDCKPEIYFIGQIVGGINFGVENSDHDGLFCELQIESSYQWDLLSEQKSIQTQTSYASKGQMNVWSHPFDIAFSTNHISHWPKGIIKVWRLDYYNKIDVYSYGIFNFPKQQGFSRIECQTWTPIGQYNQQDLFNSLSFFMGNNPRLNQLNLLLNDNKQRRNINTISNGSVIIDLDCIMKNFILFDLSGQY